LNDLLRELADHSTFKKLVKLQQQNEDNATREELALKFFAYRHDRDAFRGGVRDFLNDWMEANRKLGTVDALRTDFMNVIEGLYKIINGPFLRNNTSITPQNELEAVMVAASDRDPPVVLGSLAC